MLEFKSSTYEKETPWTGEKQSSSQSEESLAQNTDVVGHQRHSHYRIVYSRNKLQHTC